jgi:hypothetical protein
MKTFLLAVFLLGFAAPTTWAGGFNLTWGSDCWRDNPATLKTFSCDTNDGSAIFTVSFSLDFNYSKSGFLAAQLDLQSDSPTLPDWWQLSSVGGCRQAALSTAAAFAGTAGGCTDYWAGQTPSSTIYWSTALFPVGAPERAVPLPDRAQFLGAYWVDSYVPIVAGIEYFAFSVAVDYRKTVGAGACGGCGTPTAIVLNEIDLTTLFNPIRLTTPLSNGCLRWQTDGATPCGATPVRNTTWGQVKGLYR